VHALLLTGGIPFMISGTITTCSIYIYIYIYIYNITRDYVYNITRDYIHVLPMISGTITTSRLPGRVRRERERKAEREWRGEKGEEEKGGDGRGQRGRGDRFSVSWSGGQLIRKREKKRARIPPPSRRGAGPAC
jgi:hypothetical protein